MKRYLLFVLLFLVGFGACVKDELKLPSPVQFSLALENPRQGEIQVQTGSLVLGHLHAHGIRKKGDPFHFEQDYTDLLLLPFDSSYFPQKWHFDFPQGAYDSIQFGLQLNGHLGYSLRLRGRYQSRNIIRNFVFETDENLYLNCQLASNAGNSGNVILKHKELAQATIWLNAADWFDALDHDDWQQALSSMVEGQAAVLISPQQNPLLYRKVKQALNLSPYIRFRR